MKCHRWRTAGRIFGSLFSTTRRLISLFTILVMLSSCTDTSDSAWLNQPNYSGISNASFGVPELLLESRMVNLDQLRVLVMLGSQELPVQRTGDQWSGSFSLPGNGEFQLQVTWFQVVNGVELTLARSTPVSINSNSPRSVRVTDYETTGVDFDADGDQLSNFAELQAGTNPLEATPNASQFVGTWQTPCLPVPIALGEYEILSVSLTDNGVSGIFNAIFDVYMDEGCSQLPIAEFSGTSSGTYTLGNTVTTEGGVAATEADVTLTEFTDSGGVITVPATDDAFSLDIWYQDGNTLYLGILIDDIDGQLVRPTRIDFDTPFLRQ